MLFAENYSKECEFVKSYVENTVDRFYLFFGHCVIIEYNTITTSLKHL